MALVSKWPLMSVCLAFLAGPAAGAEQGDIQQCAGILNQHVRLACFDQVARQARGPATAPAPGPSQPYGTPAYQTPAYQAPAYPTYAPYASGPPGAAAATAAPPLASAVQLPKGVTRSRVLKHDWVFRKYVLILENGQVWRQIRGGRLEFPADGPAYARIQETLHDGFLLGIEGSNRLIPVRRVK